MKLKHLNPDFERMQADMTTRDHVLQNLKEAKSIGRHSCEYPDLFWFFWYCKTMGGGLLRHQIKSLSADEFESVLENVFYLFKHNEVYVAEDNSTLRLVSRPKTKESISNDLERYIMIRHDYTLRGDRFNCPAFLSESLPCLWHPRYYKYVYNKIHSRAKPPKAGDGIAIDDDDSIEEVEVKYTASGGCRQTFSPNQFHAKFFVLSIDSEMLDRVSKLLTGTKEAILPITLYECGARFVNALSAEVKAKHARNGTGRYEMSNMIEKIEKNTLYEQKDTMNVNFRRHPHE